MHSAATAVAIAVLAALVSSASAADPRVKEVTYDPAAVISVPVRKGSVTHVMLASDEAITEVASGLGADCSRSDASWCIAAQPGGRNLFVKARSAAREPNNLAVVTDRRSYMLRFQVLADGDARQPVYRLVLKPPSPPTRAPAVSASLPQLPEVREADIVAQRLGAAPQVLNASYSIAEGGGSEDIVPTLVFDDGRFTYLRFPNNREVPAVFHVLGDGSETLVNARMEGELLVVDRVSRRLKLRAGSAVVAIWNEAFDLDGVPPTDATTVPGVARVAREPAPPPATAARKTQPTAATEDSDQPVEAR
jgi:type IV secretion system protein VirB9